MNDALADCGSDDEPLHFRRKTAVTAAAATTAIAGPESVFDGCYTCVAERIACVSLLYRLLISLALEFETLVHSDCLVCNTGGLEQDSALQDRQGAVQQVEHLAHVQFWSCFVFMLRVSCQPVSCMAAIVKNLNVFPP